MKLHHTTPCKECPWRLNALQGWLGDASADYYADAVAAGEVPACHCKDNGPESDDTAFCAGALSVMANGAMIPKGMHEGQETAAKARDIVGKNPDTFKFYHMFYKHHTGNNWVHPLMRK
jgi:hypothetical protein